MLVTTYLFKEWGNGKGTLICEKEKASITPNPGGVSAPEFNSPLNSGNPSTSTLNSTPKSAGMTTGVVSPERAYCSENGYFKR